MSMICSYPWWSWPYTSVSLCKANWLVVDWTCFHPGVTFRTLQYYQTRRLLCFVILIQRFRQGGLKFKNGQGFPACSMTKNETLQGSCSGIAHSMIVLWRNGRTILVERGQSIDPPPLVFQLENWRKIQAFPRNNPRILSVTIRPFCSWIVRRTSLFVNEQAGNEFGHMLIETTIPARTEYR